MFSYSIDIGVGVVDTVIAVTAPFFYWSSNGVPPSLLVLWGSLKSAAAADAAAAAAAAAAFPLPLHFTSRALVRH